MVLLYPAGCYCELQESARNCIDDTKTEETAANRPIHVVNYQGVGVSGIDAGSGIAQEIIAQTMDSARSIDVNNLCSSVSTPEMKVSPRNPIVVPNGIGAIHQGLTMSKVVNRAGDVTDRSARDDPSPKTFDLADKLKMINCSPSATVSNASSTVSVPGLAKTGSASYVMVSREISRNVQAPSINSGRMIRRGYSDDLPNMLKRSGNRLIKTQSNNSARGTGGPAEYGHVYLNIYDLEAVNRVVNVVAGTFGAGAYHAGVEIYGHEYNFGYTPQGVSGIVQSHPRFHSQHKYRKSIDLGKTRYSPREVLEIIDFLKPMWLGTSYDILKKNCLNFADTFCKKLGVGGIPTWVMGLQNKINWTRDSLQSGAAKLKQLDEAVGISRAFGSLSRKLTGECAGGST
ncbi:PPPDE peptidase, putative [Babesia caballi]|uniref:PPPDE peptidase, putative n=1 Tax=Babesia caballi TaxID=5871 RepID=A0AAV4M168_BABCB|nr:PPPDE peptidase, putative [Babesia caballi]